MDKVFETISVLNHDEFGGYRKIAIDTSIYPLSVILKSLYWFTDRFYVQLAWQDNETRDRICVTFRAKKALEDVGEEVAGEFYNALIDQSIRAVVHQETQLVRDIIVKRAFAEALPRDEQAIANRVGL